VSGAALANVRLIALTERSVASAATTLSRLERLVTRARPGSIVVQLRDRELSARERLRFGSELRDLTRAHAQLFQVNDRLDLALLLDADGVHLGESAVSTSDARALLGPNRFVTRAWHDPERVRELDADGVLLSPVFAPRKGAPALGIEALARARTLLRLGARPLRLFALGGVDQNGVAACLDAGADGIAAVAAVIGSEAPEALLPALGIAA
jgi:thiamine-phosphate diphosphorylase